MNVLSFIPDRHGRPASIDARLATEAAAYPSRLPHRLDFYQLVLLTQGRAWGIVDGRVFDRSEGELLYCEPGQTLAIEYSGDTRRWVLCFTHQAVSDPLRTTGWKWGARLRDRDRQRVESNLTALADELAHLGPGSTVVLHSILAETLARLERTSVEESVEDRRGGSFTNRFLRCLEESFRETRRVEDYARRLHLSPRHLGTLCRRELGHSPKQIILDRVITEAKRLLLLTDASVSTVGKTLGFEDESYFYRFFRRVTGHTPSGFRTREVSRQESTTS